MEIAGALFITFLLFVFYVLLTPVILSLRYESEDNRTITGVKFFPFEYKSISDKESKKRKKIKKKPKAGLKFQYMWRLLRDEFDTMSIVIIELFNLAGNILKTPDRYYLNISLKGGLGPPDLTGEVYGVFESMKPLLGKSITIGYEPDFMTESVQGTVFAGLEVRMINVMREVLVFIWKLPKLRLIRIIRAIRKGGKDAKQA